MTEARSTSFPLHVSDRNCSRASADSISNACKKIGFSDGWTFRCFAWGRQLACQRFFENSEVCSRNGRQEACPTTSSMRKLSQLGATKFYTSSLPPSIARFNHAPAYAQWRFVVRRATPRILAISSSVKSILHRKSPGKLRRVSSRRDREQCPRSACGPAVGIASIVSGTVESRGPGLRGGYTNPIGFVTTVVDVHSQFVTRPSIALIASFFAQRRRLYLSVDFSEEN